MTTELERLIELIDDAIYAMVAGNLANESVPPATIDNWLRQIRDAAHELQAKDGER